ncbi:uncharacterized protein LOC8026208 [Ixodes scapularis]|nr:uncharacterized protein LOC8026208 [Ixodes scapularis]
MRASPQVALSPPGDVLLWTYAVKQPAGKRRLPAVHKCPCLKSHVPSPMPSPEDVHQLRCFNSSDSPSRPMGTVSNLKLHVGRLFKPATHGSAPSPSPPSSQTSIPPWNPARRIVTFVCLVSLICTAIIVAVVVAAVLLSKHVMQAPRPQRYRKLQFNAAVEVVPKPQNLVDRTNTIVVHRKSPAAWQSQSRQLQSLLDSYRTKGPCDPGGACSFPVGLVSENCSATDHFGYRTGAPCVALVFRKVQDWTPQPFTKEDLASPTVPEDVRAGYDPGLLFVSCKSEHINRDIDIRYSPYHGFPVRFFPAREGRLPPLLMLHFPNPPLKTEVWVTCRFWAKNLDQTGNGKLTFKLFVM